MARLSVLVRTDNLADQENGLLVRKVGHIGHDRASRGLDGSIELLHGVELEGALDAVGGGIARRGADNATYKWWVRQLVVRSGDVESRAAETERGFVAGGWRREGHSPGDFITLHTMRSEVLVRKRHVCLEVVFEVEGGVRDVGVENGDVNGHGAGWFSRWVRERCGSELRRGSGGVLLRRESSGDSQKRSDQGADKRCGGYAVE